MPARQSNEGQLVAEVAVLLGAKPGAPADAVTRELVAKLTQKELLGVSRKLGLASVSKLKKDALAAEVWGAWTALLKAAGGNGHTDGNGAGAPVVMGTVPALAPTPAPAVGNPGVDAAAVPQHAHKFEVGQQGRPASEQNLAESRAVAREIPWGYGRDRVTAMVVDPDRFFAYWEVLDQSIERARAQLGPGGPGAWLNLRVYDVTGRIFDGTNAHSNFDHRVERGDRQYFFTINKPTSEIIVELGLKSDEGYFVKIARSARIEFPRSEPAAPSEPEWLTVRIASGHIERAGVGMPGRPGRPGGHIGGSAPAGAGAPLGWDGTPRGIDGAMGHLRRGPWNGIIPEGAQSIQWEQVGPDGTVELHREFQWTSPPLQSSWEAGPFPYPVEVPVPVREAFAGKTRVYRVGTQTHIVYGPWQVTIRGLGAEHTRTVLSRWEVYRSWGQEVGHELEEFASAASTVPGGGSERMVGASGRRWVGSSELRFAGSSEQYFLKASEIRLGGSSETMFAGASQWVMRGASERRFAGASEWQARGSSERLFAGSSERLHAGSSERLGTNAAGDARFAGGAQPAVASAVSVGVGGVYPPPPVASPSSGKDS